MDEVGRHTVRSRRRQLRAWLVGLRGLAPHTEMSRWRRMLVGHLQVLRLVVRRSAYQRVKLHAQALTFDTLLGVVPVLVVVFALLEGLYGSAQISDQVRDFVLENLAASPETRQVVGANVERFVSNVLDADLGALPIVVLLYSVLSLLGHIEDSFNAIFGYASRSFGKRLLIHWSLITSAPILLGASLGLTGAFQSWEFVQGVSQLGWVSNSVLRALPFLLTWVAFSLFYLVMPAQKIRLRSAVWAALWATAAWSLAKYGYAVYARNALTLQNIYGAVATVPLFVLWLYVSWLVLLFGARLAFALQHVHTFWQDEEASQSSQAYRERLATRMYLELCQRFARDEPPMDTEALATVLRGPRRLMDTLVAQLSAGGFLALDDEGRVLLAKDPAKVTPQDLEHYLRAEVGTSPELQRDAGLELLEQPGAKTSTYRELVSQRSGE